MANTTSTILLLLPTFLLLIFLYFSYDFHENHFIIKIKSPLNLFSSPSHNLPVNKNHFHHVIHLNNHSSFFASLKKVNGQEKKKNERSNLTKVEDGLARARATIRKAARSRNYTSEEQGTFIPRGSVYRNPYAFHQSHTEMIERFKIYVYKEGEPPFVHQGPVNNIYGVEGQFIGELESGMSNFITQNPNEAHMFFLPFSVARMVTILYRPLVSYNRGPLHWVLLDYVTVVAEKYPFWNRSHGADHFMVSCHDWAPEISEIKPDFFKNFVRVLCNANSSEGFKPIRDVSIPEVNIPAGQLGPPSLGVRLSRRQIFAFFAGGAHGHVRKALFDHWKNNTTQDADIQVHEYLPENQDYFKMLGQSKFCLCPSGYEVASPRIVEAIYAECVPVIIKDNYSLPFNDVLDWTKFSVHIPVARIPEIKSILKGISFREYARLVKGVRSVKWHFTLNRPSKPYDLIHMVLHSLWLRRINVRLPS